MQLVGQCHSSITAPTIKIVGQESTCMYGSFHNKGQSSDALYVAKYT